jgi:hypothetical protein
MIVSLWEWTVTRDADGGSVGVSGTRHGAMAALAKALVQAGRPRTGRVVPVILAGSIHQPSYYLRGFVRDTADYDGTVIRWS